MRFTKFKPLPWLSEKSMDARQSPSIGIRTSLGKQVENAVKYLVSRQIVELDLMRLSHCREIIRRRASLCLPRFSFRQMVTLSS